MSTVMKKGTAPILPPPVSEPRDDKQLRRDRRTATIVLAALIALLALIIWLAGMGGPIEYQDTDYWHIMS